MPVRSADRRGRRHARGDDRLGRINIPASVYVRRRDFEAFEASFDFLPAERIPLRLLSIAPKANANQLYAARLAVPSGIDPAPAPGMNTLVTLRLRTPEDARLGVPATALFSHEGESSVWLLRPDNTVEGRPVPQRPFSEADSRPATGS